MWYTHSSVTFKNQRSCEGLRQFSRAIHLQQSVNERTTSPIYHCCRWLEDLNELQGGVANELTYSSITNLAVHQ